MNVEWVPFFGIFVVAFFVIYSAFALIGTFQLARRIESPSSRLLIDVDRDDPRIPPDIIKAISDMTEKMAALGFEEMALVMNPKGISRGTLYLSVFANHETQESALGIIARRASSSVGIQHSSIAFVTHFLDGTELNTAISRQAAINVENPRSRLLQLHGIDDFQLLHRIHRFRVSKTGLPVKAPASTRGQTIQDLKDGIDQTLADEIKYRWAIISPDGSSRRMSFKAVFAFVWVYSFPSSTLVSSIRQHRVGTVLKEMGELDAYKQYAARRHQTRGEPTLSERLYGRGAIFLFSGLTSISIAGFYCDPLRSHHWAGAIFIFGFTLFTLLFRSTPIQKRKDYCKHCGEPGEPGMSICALCGEGECRRCEYNLFGNQSGICPECGHPTSLMPSPDADTFSKQQAS